MGHNQVLMCHTVSCGIPIVQGHKMKKGAPSDTYMLVEVDGSTRRPFDLDTVGRVLTTC